MKKKYIQIKNKLQCRIALEKRNNTGMVKTEREKKKLVK